MSLPKACLFDLDGLLIDTEPLHGKAWSNTAEFLGTKLSENQLLALRGRRRIDCAHQVNAWLENPVGTEQLLTIHQPIARELLRTAKAMPFAESLVRWCSQQRMPMALVTSSTSKAVAFKTQSHSWIELIETRVFGDNKSLKRGKPSPDPFLLAAKLLNVSPEFCWALEDSPAGTQAALAAGCQVWVLTPDKEKERLNNSPLTPNPRHIHELKSVLKELQKEWSKTSN